MRSARPGRRAGSLLPRWTVRLRLMLVYGGLFLVSGVALLTVTYVLVRQDIGNDFVTTTKNGIAAFVDKGSPGGVAVGFASVPKTIAAAPTLTETFQ